MGVPAIDTPRTDLAASFTHNGTQLAEFTQSSIPSPSKDRNELVKGLRGLRQPSQRTPRSRLPFAERHNSHNGKAEFTPLLKSAAKNRSAFAGKENLGINRNKPATPAGFRESYRSDLADLPEHSSVLYEDDTASERGKQATPQLPQTSSSIVNTPVPALETSVRNGAFGEAQYGSLREQEARVEQLDKDNWGLKLRIFYLEESQRKSGKEFNDALVKQITDLQIDKLTLQRDLKHYRRQLSVIQEEAKTKHTPHDASVNPELERMKQALADREAEIKAMREAADIAEDRTREMEKLRGEVGDLEHELRQKDQELDEKDDRIDELDQAQASSEEIENLKSQLRERDEDIQGLQDALRAAGAETDRKLKEKDRALELKDDEVRDMEEELRNAGREESFAAKGRELDDRQAEIDRLRMQLVDSARDAGRELADLRNQLESAEQRAVSHSHARETSQDEKDSRIRMLEQKLSNAETSDEEMEKLQDRILDLEADLRQRDRSAQEKADLVDELNNKIRQVENDSDDELMAAQDRIQELEVEQQRRVKDLQTLRDTDNKDAASRSQALETAEHRILELDAALNQAREMEKQLQKELHRLRDDISHLEGQLDEKDEQIKANSDSWAKQRTSHEADRCRAQEKVHSLESAISRLRESQGTLSGKELALQNLLDDAKQQHTSAQDALQKRLDDMAEHRDELMSSLQNARSQIRDAESQASNTTTRQRELRDKVQSLEDEIEVLQASLDQHTTNTKDELSAARSEAEGLRRQLTGVEQDLAKAELEQAATKAQLDSQQNRHLQSTPVSKSTPAAQRELRSRVDELESEVRAAAKLEAELKQVERERETLIKRLKATEAREQVDHDEHLPLVDSEPVKSSITPVSPSKHVALECELSTLRSQLHALQEQKDQLDDDLDVLTSDLDAATAARDQANTTARDLRKQLSDVQRAADHKFRSQVAEYERDIGNLEEELSTARSMQREQEIKAESANATVVRLRKRLESTESDLAVSRARERTSSESPEAGRQERRELQDAVRKAERRADNAKADLADREVESLALRERESDLREQLATLQRDRRAAVQMAESAASDLAAHQRLHANSLDDVAVTKLRNRHGAELRGLAKQIEYLSAKSARAERLRQDAGFAKSYVGRVVEVYARVHRMDLRLVREMGVVIPVEGEEQRAGGVDTDGRMVMAGGRVDATPRTGSKRKGMVSEVAPRRREKRPSLGDVALAVRACVRMKKRKEEWDVKKRMHEGVLRKWREGRADRRKVKV